MTASEVPLTERMTTLLESMDRTSDDDDQSYVMTRLIVEAVEVLADYRTLLTPRLTAASRDELELRALLDEAVPRLFGRVDPSGRRFRTVDLELRGRVVKLQHTYAELRRLDDAVGNVVAALQEAINGKGGRASVRLRSTLVGRLPKLLLLLIVSAMIMENGGTISAWGVEATVPDGQISHILDEITRSLGFGDRGTSLTD